MQVAGDSNVYLLYSTTVGGSLQKVLFPSMDAMRNPYKQTYWDSEFSPNEIVTIDPKELASYPDSGIVWSTGFQLPGNNMTSGNGNPPAPDGKLISDGPTGQTIAIVSNGQKRQFPSQSVFDSLGYHLCNVVRDDNYTSYPTGPNVTLPSTSQAPTITSFNISPTTATVGTTLTSTIVGYQGLILLPPLS